jgi:hypothetical protein
LFSCLLVLLSTCSFVGLFGQAGWSAISRIN